jgi:hypothetical protein
VQGFFHPFISAAKVVPVPQATEPPASPADSRALDMVAEAEKNAREQKLNQSCLQLSKCDYFMNCIVELRQSRLNKYLQAFVGSEI